MSVLRCEHRTVRMSITAAIVALLPIAPAYAQSVEEHNVETISSQELGPYRPEHRPKIDDVERLIRQLTNQFRQDEGLSVVESNDKLQQTAQKFAQYMARTDRYGHTADGQRPSQRAKEQKYDYCLISENIAYQFRTSGYPTEELAEQFVTGWKNSPPHRKNMVDPDVTQIGVGVAQSEKTGAYYAVQMFGRPKSQAIRFTLSNRAGKEVRYRIGKKQFSLPARFDRTHEVCRPPEVTFADGKESKADKLSIKPTNDERFVIEQNGEGRLVIERASEGARPVK